MISAEARAIPPNGAFVDLEFLQAFRDRGAEFMVLAAEKSPTIFDAMIEAGWADTMRYSTQGANFCLDLGHIQDADRASHALKSFLKNAPNDDLRGMLLSPIHGGNNQSKVAMVEWLNRDDRSSEWRIKMTKAALAVGADFTTVFSFSTQDLSARRHTLMSSLLMRAYMPDDDGENPVFRNEGALAIALAPIADMAKAGVEVDPRTIRLTLAFFEPNESCAIVDFLRDHAGLSATKALESLDTQGLKPGAIAYLSSLSAREAIDEVMATGNIAGAAPGSSWVRP